MSFFNLKLNTKLTQKVLLMASIYALSLVIFSSCQPQTPIADTKGDIKALIPLVAGDQEQLSEVTLKKIENLKEVSGGYVKFYYTPGADQKTLTGGSPQGRFIRTSNGIYVPSDVITQQMFALYYHIQSLTDLNLQISPELQTAEPFQVGLNTRVIGTTSTGNNNAFYDGQSNALLIVPYDLNHAPISINAGIIAHEFFHSVFYRVFFNHFLTRQKVLAADQTPGAKTKLLFNETYVRGLNEGLADFWGWIYTSNVDFISLSLPEFGQERKITLDANQEGVIQSQDQIESKISEAQALAINPSEILTGYTYKIGTPHARFLKELTVRLSRDSNTDLEATKLRVAKAVYQYLKILSQETSTFNATSTLSADHFFQFIAQPEKSGLVLSLEQCDFVKKYVSLKDRSENVKVGLCKGSNE